MKTTCLLIAVTVLIHNGSYGQLVDDTLCTDFESHTSFLQLDTNSIWEIGMPQKTVFDTSYESVFSIVTDTQNTYPANDTSYFYAKYGYSGAAVWNYLGVYAPFQVQFRHRFDMDSLSDFGAMDISTDGGLTWEDALTDRWSSIPFDKPSYNSHLFENTGDTIYDSLRITGSSGGWVHSTVTVSINEISNDSHHIDSILVRFAFYCDSVETFKDGWQIDDLCLIYKMGGLIFGVDDFESGNISLFPNPASGTVNLSMPQKHSDKTIAIRDVLGKTVYELETSESELKMSVDNFPDGLYWLTVQVPNENKSYSGRLVIMH